MTHFIGGSSQGSYPGQKSQIFAIFAKFCNFDFGQNSSVVRSNLPPYDRSSRVRRLARLRRAGGKCSIRTIATRDCPDTRRRQCLRRVFYRCKGYHATYAEAPSREISEKRFSRDKGKFLNRISLCGKSGFRIAAYARRI